MSRHRKVSYVIPYPHDNCDGHALGVNHAVELPSVDGGSSSLLTAGRDTHVLEWRGSSVVSRVATHADWVNHLAVVPGSGRTFVSASADHRVVLHTDQGLAQAAQHVGAVKQVAVSAKTCMSVGTDGAAMLLDMTRNMQCCFSTRVHSPLYSVARAPHCDSVFYCGAGDGTLYQLDCREARARDDPNLATIDSIPGHGDAVRCVVFSGGHTLFTAGTDGLIRAWDVRNLSATPPQFRVHTDSVWALQPLPDAPYTILSGGRDGAVVATNTRTLQTLAVAQLPYPVTALALTTNFASSASVAGSSPGPESAHRAHDGEASLVCCTTGPDVYRFDLPQTIGHEIRSSRRSRRPSVSLTPGGTLGPSSKDDFVSPSRISVECVDMAPVCELVETDESQYEAGTLEEPQWPSDDARLQWCGPNAARWRPALHPTPAATLQGREGVSQVALLNTKVHAVVATTRGALALWDVVKRVQLQVFPRGATFTAVFKALNARVPKHFVSWCHEVSARWGAICVTLAVDSAASAVVSPYELDRVAALLQFPPHSKTEAGAGPADPAVRLFASNEGRDNGDLIESDSVRGSEDEEGPRAAGTAEASTSSVLSTVPEASRLSIHTTPREVREDLRAAPLVNIGVGVLRGLCALRRHSVVGEPPSTPSRPNRASEVADTPPRDTASSHATPASAKPSTPAVVPSPSNRPPPDRAQWPRMVVWSTPAHYAVDDTAAVSEVAPFGQRLLMTADDPRVPTWVHHIVVAPAAQYQQIHGTVTVTLQARHEKSPVLPQVRSPTLAYPKHTLLTEIIGDVATACKVTSNQLPTLDEANAALEEQGLPILVGAQAKPPEGQATRVHAPQLMLDEFIVLSVDDADTRDIVALLDPLLTLGAIALQHRVRGGHSLVITYQTLHDVIAYAAAKHAADPANGPEIE